MVKNRPAVRRGEVYRVILEPTIGTEIRKTRPALVVSADDMNHTLPQVIVAPITGNGQPLGCRPKIMLEGRSARILLDEIRCIDKSRLLGRIDHLPEKLWHETLLRMLA